MAKFSVLPLTRRTNKRNSSERICNDNLWSNPSHNWRWIMSAPTSSGVSGDGGLGRGRTLVSRERPRFYNNAGVLIVKFY